MLKKAWLEKIRRPVSFIIEVCLPIALTLIIYWIYTVVVVQYVDDQSYHNRVYSTYPMSAIASHLNQSNRVIAIAPKNNLTIDFANWLCEKNPGFDPKKAVPGKADIFDFLRVPPLKNYIKFFDSSEDMNYYLQNTDNLGYDDGIPDIYMGIIFNEHKGSNWTYTLRSFMTDVPSMYSEEFLMNDFSKKASTGNINSYMKGSYLEYSSLLDTLAGNTVEKIGFNGMPGVSSFVQSIDRYIMKKKTDVSLSNNYITNAFKRSYFLNSKYTTKLNDAVNGLTSDEQKTFLVEAKNMLQEQYYMPHKQSFLPYPTKAYRTSEFFDMIGTLYPIFFLITFMYPCFWLLRGIVEEKEKGIRETLKTMGLNELALILAWITLYLIEFAVIAIGSSLILLTVFAYTNPFMLALYFFLFGYVLVMLCYLITSFFNKAKSAGLFGILIIFLTNIPSFLVTANVITSRPAFIGISFISTVAFSMGITRIADLEAETTGFTIGSSNIMVEGYSVADAMFFMFIDGLIYYFLGRYFDQVMPKNYGLSQPWYFPFTASFWKGGIYNPKHSKKSMKIGNVDIEKDLLPGENNDTSGLIKKDNYEPVSIDLNQMEKEDKVLKVHDLVKVFSTPVGPKTAVNKLDVTMYEGQIFVMLGHNGAGKTTSLSILSGMIPPTDGDASIYGYDIYTQMPQIRSVLSLCPQFDILWDNLTVYEHMYISAMLQGVPKSKVDKKIKDLVYDVGLNEKLHKMSKTLSGGQKRKLSVAMSLVGDAKVVFLDEPTSGMDPYSRRIIWNLLRNYRKNRIIILTTHFMDEADLLGDRIGIMADGKMFTCGSSNFLKHKFGVGYNMTIVKEEDCDEDLLKQTVSKIIPESSLLTNVGLELTYQLPFSSSSKFITLFKVFDDNLQTLGIATYGISVTTMEEVFLNSAKYVDEELTREENESHPAEVSNIPGNPGDSVEMSQQDLMKARVKHLEGQINKEDRKDFQSLTSDIHENLFWRHFYANFIKRFTYAKRDWKMFVMEICVPLMILIFAFTMTKLVFTMTSLNPQTMNTHMYNTKLSEDLRYKSRGYYANNTSKYSYMDSLDRNSFNPIPVNISHYKNLQVCASLANYLWCNDPFNPPSSLQMDLIAISRVILNNAYDHYRDSSYHSFVEYCTQDFTNVYHLLNSTSRHSAIISQIYYDEAIYRKETHDPTATITMINHPLPLNSAASEVTSSAISIAISQDLVIAVAFIPAYMILFLVKEKEVGMKHQQIISGLNIPAFWCSTFLWDYITYLVVALLSVFLMWAFGMDTFIKGNKLGATLALFLLYGFCTAPFTYCLSFLFNSHTIALIVVLFINILCCIMEIASYIMLMLKDTCEQVKWWNYFLFYLFPGFSFGIGFMRLSMLEMIPALDAMCDYYSSGAFNVDMSEVNPFSMRGIGTSYLYLFGLGIIYFIIAILLDYATNDVKLLYAFEKHKDVNIQRSKDVDDDVQEEEDRIMNGESNDILQLKQLRKVYNGEKIAVDKVTYGLPKGECFGLLGINGAGKTTTMKMLSGEIAPTKGTAELCGYDMMKEPLKVRRLLGMCPQTHALLDLLTVREHLELFGRIKGVKDEDLEEVIQLRMEDMGITEYENKKANSLSGGNKRKLNVAQALIGNPPLVLMDEPSTGMDPVSRRALWDIISTVSARKKECTIIITTHSMEEAEALCTKVAIMVGGRLRCIGTIQHLKNKFGHGYTLTTRLIEPTPEDIQKTKDKIGCNKDDITMDDIRGYLVKLDRVEWFEEISSTGSGWVIFSDIQKLSVTQAKVFCEWYILEERYRYLESKLDSFFNDVEVTERHGGLVTIRIDTKGLRLSDIFSYLESIKKKCSIEEYSIAQITLEQIFNYFASQQEEETRAVQGVKKANKHDE
ncbi:hypothetical protein WA158_004332 [Blastocystis sp. Blastoise]